jgi:hypothetical protein
MFRDVISAHGTVDILVANAYLQRIEMNSINGRSGAWATAYKGMRRFLLVLVVMNLSATEAVAQKPMMSVDKDLPLSAEQTADTIGLLPLFVRIKELQSSANASDREERVELQQQILLRVVSASLQVGAATGQIDAEIADTRELESYLIGRRDSKADLLNLASLGVGGTVGTANSILGFTNHNTASAVTSVVADTVTLGFSIWELKIRGGQARVLQTPSNMLSEIFGRPSDMSDLNPPVVIKFMNAVPPDDPDGLSRQDRLIRSWVKVGRLPPPNTPKGREKIVHLTSQPGDGTRQSIEDLDDRQAMLYDLRVRLSHIQQDLATLLEDIPTAPMEKLDRSLP